MVTSFYFTARALMIQLLDDNTHPDVIKWIEKGKIVELHDGRLYDIWKRVSGYESSCISEGAKRNAFDFSFSSGTEYVKTGFSKFGYYNYKLLTKSTDRRKIVNDFTGNTLIEWIMQMLLEQTHTDIIGWSDKDKKEFVISDTIRMGEVYHGKSMYHIKLQLSSYCMTGVLIKVDKNCYQFDEKWYIKEKYRTRKLISQDVITLQEKNATSFANFPTLTSSLY